MTTQKEIDTLVIGGGQAGLAMGYHLLQAEIPFQIVDANSRTGDSWRHRWDSLRLFTPNRFNSLPGLPISGDDWGFPTKDELAEYLEAYAEHFQLPIRHDTRVECLARSGDVFSVSTADVEYEAANVVVAMSNFQEPKRPEFAERLDRSIVQRHVAEYENPGQLEEGDVLVVGLGNSGADIAMELSERHHVFLSGEPSAVQPFRPERLSGRLLMPFVGKVLLNKVLTTNTPMGRRARTKMLHKAAPLLRVKPRDLAAAGVERVGRTVGVVDGLPAVEGGRVLDVSNVVWCTGFDPGFSWVDLDVFDDQGDVIHDRGVVDGQPGLYFVGLKFLFSALSDTLSAIGRDTKYVVDHIVAREDSLQPAGMAG